MTIDHSIDESEIVEARESRERHAEAYQLAEEWTRAFLAVDDEASKCQYQDALHLIEAANFPRDVGDRLTRAIDTKDGDLIEQVFREYKGRLGHAFCESCWSAKGGER